MHTLTSSDSPVDLPVLFPVQVITMKRSRLEQMISGNTINLAANDARRLEVGAVWCAFAVTAPVDAAASVFLLWYLIGWEALAGAAIMLLVVLYTVVMTRKTAQLRHKAAAVTDQRLSVMNEVIPGIRTLKMYAWEENYLGLIGRLRK